MSHKSASSTAVAPPGAHHQVRSYSNLLPARPFKRSVASRLCLLRRVRTRMAHRDASLRRTDWVAFGGIADMPGALRTARCDAIDPKRTSARLKSRSAVAFCHIVWRHGKGGRQRRLDSEQFRLTPRTCRPLRGRLSVR
jgi:hypothetical protein